MRLREKRVCFLVVLVGLKILVFFGVIVAGILLGGDINKLGGRVLSLF